MTGSTGVVVMAYGSPSSLDDLEEYYTHIRRGRPPSEEQLAELRARYEAIGGISPLVERTRAQVRSIEQQLAQLASDRYRVGLGMKHAAPFIEDAVETLTESGVDKIVALVLTPHYSSGSVGEYVQRAREAAGTVEVSPVESWHLDPAYLDFLASGVREGLDALPEQTKVLFTAHSLPERVLVDDPYPDQLLESASAVARMIGLRPWPDWALAWQSAGRTPESWRGPDILTVIRDLADTGRARGLLVCPQGFVADHLEVLYDLDIEARRVAEESGLVFARTRSINDNPEVMAALARQIHSRAGASV